MNRDVNIQLGLGRYLVLLKRKKPKADTETDITVPIKTAQKANIRCSGQCRKDATATDRESDRPT